MDYLTLDWPTYHQKVFKLSQKIIQSGKKFDLIIAISRGGLTLAHILSDFIDLPITSFTISSYHDLRQTGVPKIVLKLGDKLHNKKILLVDDISDTGKTFIRGISYLKSLGAEEIATASILIKEKTEHTPDFFVEQAPNHAWVIFPYEIRETIKALAKTMSKTELEKLKIPKPFIDHYTDVEKTG